MKGKKYLSLLLALPMLVSGCSCSKVNQNTYTNAIDDFNSTDGIQFKRKETVYKNKNDKAKYSYTTIEGTYIFETSRFGNVYDFEYEIKNFDIGSINTSNIKYVYTNGTLYRKKMIRSQEEDKAKQNIAFNDFFNVNRCKDKDCLKIISTNIAPIYEINNLENFQIRKDGEEAVVNYKAACPSFEECNGNETLDYTMRISSNGKIKKLFYVISQGEGERTISYDFKKYSSKEIGLTTHNINYQDYIEKEIE